MIYEKAAKPFFTASQPLLLAALFLLLLGFYCFGLRFWLYAFVSCGWGKERPKEVSFGIL
jgi:hypothetical protein